MPAVSSHRITHLALSFLLLGCAARAAAPAAAPPAVAACVDPAARPPLPTAPLPVGPGPIVYVGGFRPEIDVYRLDMNTLALARVGQVANPPAMPSFFAWAPSGKFAYSVDESDKGLVVAYAVDPATGLLTRLNDAPAYGVGPTYIALDRTGRWALTASWAGDEPASISVLPIAADGKVGKPVDSHVFSVNGHAHFIAADPSNRYVFASINGERFIAQYRFDAATGKLTENTPLRAVRTPTPGDPRHLDFDPRGRFLYAGNESASSVTVFRLDGATGRLAQLQDISTLPAGWTGGNSTAQILVHPSGKFLYISNRGHDSIAIFAVDGASGRLTFVAHQPVGKHPRNFNFDPSGKLLLVASRDEASVTIYKIDPGTGLLTQAGAPVAAGERPTYVGVLDIPGR